jgi:microcin C transport system substrate-binding protein
MTIRTSRRDLIAAAGSGAALATLRPISALAQSAAVAKGGGVAMHGEPKYKDGFAHFEYANPNAPKGGSILHGAGGATFDNLNPFILKGTAAAFVGSLSFDRLMKRAEDEAFSMYGLIAKTIEMPADRSWATFELDERARFHDGSPVTAEDVIFSLEILVGKGRAFFQQYFRDVKKAEKVGPRAVKFTFTSGENRELPLIVAGDLPIIPKAYWASREFDAITLDPPLGGGPYKVGQVSPGRFITFDRVKDYWAAELPANRGYNNFDLVRVEYYRDATIAREAFKAGEFDYRAENQATAWATAYDIPAVRDGLMMKREVKHSRPAGMQAFAFNTRRPMFQDWRVRRALGLVFDFEWTNKNLFVGLYVRTKSFFANSEMAATGLPQGDELKLLERFRGRIPDRVFSETYDVPVYPGDGNIRAGIGEALKLLKEAGWDIQNGKLVHLASKREMSFEILSESQQFERIYLPYIRNLKRLGVEAQLRIVDPAQYQKRVEKFDFDMITDVWGQSESPGNEQRDMWSTAAAGQDGSNNTIGIKDKAIDELVELIIAAPDRESLVLRCRALDRVLLHHHFVVPGWHVASDRMVYWDKFGVSTPHRRGTSWLNWWFDAAKAERLKGRIRSLN